MAKDQVGSERSARSRCGMGAKRLWIAVTLSTDAEQLRDHQSSICSEGRENRGGDVDFSERESERRPSANVKMNVRFSCV